MNESCCWTSICASTGQGGGSATLKVVLRVCGDAGSGATRLGIKQIARVGGSVGTARGSKPGTDGRRGGRRETPRVGKAWT